MNFQIENGVLVSYDGSTPDVIIPSCITEIGGSAFLYRHNLKSVIITGNVKKIGSRAFEGCSNLEKVIIPEGVTTIEQEGFRRCSNLNELVLPKSVTAIGYSAFQNCTNLNEIVIPEGVTTIGRWAFEGTKWLENKKATEKDAVIVNGIAIEKANNIGESVNLEGIKEIKEGVFKWCDKIKDFVVSDGTKINDDAFLTENDFNICLKNNDFFVNIPVSKNEIVAYKVSKHQYSRRFNDRTQNLFRFIGVDMADREMIFDDLEIPEYRYPLAVFMANSYKSEFFRTFVDVHFEKILEYAKKNDPDLLKFINRIY